MKPRSPITMSTSRWVRPSCCKELNVGRNGTVIGQEYRMSFSDLVDERPAIAYCPGRNRFLVTWTRTIEYNFEEVDADVYGQFVAGDGTTLLGSNIAIASSAKNQFNATRKVSSVADPGASRRPSRR